MSAADEILLPASLHTALDVFEVEACKLSDEIGVSIDDIKMIRSMTVSLFEVMAQRSRDGQDTNEEKRAETKTSKIQRLTKENEKLKKRLEKVQEAASEDRKIIQKQNKLIALQSDINTQQKKNFDIKSSKAMEVVEAQIQAVDIMSKMSTSTLRFFEKFNQRDRHHLSKFYKYLDGLQVERFRESTVVKTLQAVVQKHDFDLTLLQAQVQNMTDLKNLADAKVELLEVQLHSSYQYKRLRGSYEVAEKDIQVGGMASGKRQRLR